MTSAATRAFYRLTATPVNGIMYTISEIGTTITINATLYKYLPGYLPTTKYRGS